MLQRSRLIQFIYNLRLLCRSKKQFEVSLIQFMMERSHTSGKIVTILLQTKETWNLIFIQFMKESRLTNVQFVIILIIPLHIKGIHEGKNRWQIWILYRIRLKKVHCLKLIAFFNFSYLSFSYFFIPLCLVSFLFIFLFILFYF